MPFRSLAVSLWAFLTPALLLCCHCSARFILLELDEDGPRIEMENEQEIKSVQIGRVGNKTLGEDEEEKIVKVGEKIFANGKY